MLRKRKEVKKRTKEEEAEKSKHEVKNHAKEETEKTSAPLKLDKGLSAQIATFAKDGEISLNEAKKIWAATLDGGEVSQAEYATLRQALDNPKYNFSQPARNYLEHYITNEERAPLNIIEKSHSVDVHLQVELERITGLLAAANTENAMLKARTDILEQRLKRSERAYAELENNLESNKAPVHSVENHHALESKNSQSKQQVESLLQQIKALERENQHLKVCRSHCHCFITHLSYSWPRTSESTTGIATGLQ
jgi:hypothetical protein